MTSITPSTTIKIIAGMSYTFTSEDVARGPVATLTPLDVRFSSEKYSKESLKVTYLYPDHNGARQVFAVDLSSSTAFDPRLLFDATASVNGGELSLQEQLRRERMRLFTSGIASYQWASNGGKMMIPMAGRVLIYDESIANEDDRLYVLYDGSSGEAFDPQLSPDGNLVAFVINNDLYVLPIPASRSTVGGNAAPLRLTTQGAVPGLSCGVADYIAQEEMHRFKGFWWSPSSRRIAYTIVDERHVPVFQISHASSADPHHAETHRYPFTGKRNAIVQVAVVEITAELWTQDKDKSKATSSPSSVLLDVCAADSERADWADDHYIARVGFWPDDSVMVQVQNRQQNVLDLLLADSVTGRCHLLVRELSSSWVNLHDDCHAMSVQLTDESSSAFEFLWASERSGFNQLYCYDVRVDGKTPAGQASGTVTSLRVTCALKRGGRPIGTGLGDDVASWIVDSVCAVDEKKQLVYFLGNRGNPTEKHLYMASICEDGTAIRRLTSQPGFHTCSVHPASGFFVDTFSSLDWPSVTQLCRLPAGTDIEGGSVELVATLLRAADWDARRFLAVGSSLVKPEIRSMPSRDGRHTLYYCLYRPNRTNNDDDNDRNADAPLPTIVSVYGGPHVQYVSNQWIVRSDLRAQMLAQQGYLVVRIDNRGSARRGLDFESAIYEDMGRLEVDDQAHVISQLAAEGLVDRGRVGIYGWSYGGYMTLMCLCRAPEIFSAGVSGAPVTSWDGYDTHYTERYMNHPDNNPAGYESSSVMSHVDRLLPSQRLLLIHGLIDENVHFRHTARLIDALVRAQKRYELLLFPSERHSPHKTADRVFMSDQIARFFSEALPISAAGSTTPPVPAVSSQAANAPTAGNKVHVFSKI